MKIKIFLSQVHPPIVYAIVAICYALGTHWLYAIQSIRNKDTICVHNNVWVFLKSMLIVLYNFTSKMKHIITHTSTNDNQHKCINTLHHVHSLSADPKPMFDIVLLLFHRLRLYIQKYCTFRCSRFFNVWFLKDKDTFLVI